MRYTVFLMVLDSEAKDYEEGDCPYWSLTKSVEHPAQFRTGDTIRVAGVDDAQVVRDVCWYLDDSSPHGYFHLEPIFACDDFVARLVEHFDWAAKDMR